MPRRVSQKKKRVPALVIVLIFVTIPVLIAAAAFCWVGMYYCDDDLIYPNTSIAGVNVSWMTRSEALQALDLSDFDERVGKASVTIIFPDDTELIVDGTDINMTHDAVDVVESAYLAGRRQGFVGNTIEFLKRLSGKEFELTIQNFYDYDVINLITGDFVEEYNERLAAAEPRIYNDKIVITKGAGYEFVETMILADIAYIGLFESLETGAPVEIIYKLPETATDSRQLLDIHQKIHIPVESSELNFDTLSASESTVGVDFDLIQAVNLLNEAETGKTVTIDVFYIQPDTTQEYLQGLLFRDLIGEQTTHVAGTTNRLINIKVSSEAISGLVLLPGDEFSFNNVVGRRTYNKGYRMGGAYIGSETVPVIGGGVCQTASTLHAAIVDSEILISERHGHSRPVPYLRRGRDATVFWEKLDFRFINNTDYPIRLDFELVDRSLTAKVYGTIIDDFPAPSIPMPAG
ncbi:MAG: VanW family protein [Oscillospiraceae bacterium]|nr:VanW family protein [Oscillospiraceae bacterium]